MGFHGFALRCDTFGVGVSALCDKANATSPEFHPGAPLPPHYRVLNRGDTTQERVHVSRHSFCCHVVQPSQRRLTHRTIYLRACLTRTRCAKRSMRAMFELVEEVLSAAHAMYQAEDATPDDLRIIFQLFTTTNPAIIHFTKQWLRAKTRFCLRQYGAGLDQLYGQLEYTRRADRHSIRTR